MAIENAVVNLDFHYVVACTRMTPVKNIYLADADLKDGLEKPEYVWDLTMRNPPNSSVGNYATNVELMHVVHQNRKYAAIFALPRHEWITLPDAPALAAGREEALLGEIIFQSDMKNADIADYCTDGFEPDIIQIVPKNPLFTVRWLSKWTEQVAAVQKEYRERRKSEIEAKDPYRVLRKI